MPIVSSEIVSSTIQADGSLNVHERHTDHLDKTYDVVYLSAKSADPAKTMADRVASLDAAIAESEMYLAVFVEAWDYSLKYTDREALLAYARERYLESTGEVTAQIATRIVEWVSNGRYADKEFEVAFGKDGVSWEDLKADMVNLSISYETVKSGVGE